jgi:hypothetical protein
MRGQAVPKLKMNKRIFLSYSHEDAQLAKSVITSMPELQEEHVVIDDPASLPGIERNPRRIIGEALSQADSIVVVWSNQAARSSWVHYEIGMAEALGLPIRVVIAEGTDAQFPGRLLANQQSSLREPAVPHI